jgi:hypothetical protein
VKFDLVVDGLLWQGGRGNAREVGYGGDRSRRHAPAATEAPFRHVRSNVPTAFSPHSRRVLAHPTRNARRTPTASQPRPNRVPTASQLNFNHAHAKFPTPQTTRQSRPRHTQTTPEPPCERGSDRIQIGWPRSGDPCSGAPHCGTTRPVPSAYRDRPVTGRCGRESRRVRGAIFAKRAFSGLRHGSKVQNVTVF